MRMLCSHFREILLEKEIVISLVMDHLAWRTDFLGSKNDKNLDLSMISSAHCSHVRLVDLEILKNVMLDSA